MQPGFDQVGMRYDVAVGGTVRGMAMLSVICALPALAEANQSMAHLGKPEAVAGMAESKRAANAACDATAAISRQPQRAALTRLAEERRALEKRKRELQDWCANANASRDHHVSQIQQQLAAIHAAYRQVSGEALHLRQQAARLDRQISQSVAFVPRAVPKSRHGGKCSLSRPIRGRTYVAVPKVSPGLIAARGNLLSRLRMLQTRQALLQHQAQPLQYRLHQVTSHCQRQVAANHREQRQLEGQIDQLLQHEQRLEREAVTQHSCPVTQTPNLVTDSPVPLEGARKRVLRVSRQPQLDPYRALLMSIGRLPESGPYHRDADNVVTSRDAWMILVTTTL